MNTQKIEYGFTGRYAHSAENLANKAIEILGCSVDQAKRLGNSFMADYGKLKKVTKDDGVTLKFGKLDKDGNISITEIETMASSGIATPAISIARAVYQLDKVISLKNGMLWGESNVTLVKRLNDWLFEVKEAIEIEEEAGALVNA